MLRIRLSTIQLELFLKKAISCRSNEVEKMKQNKDQQPIGLRNKILQLLLFFKDRFDLHEGKEDELETIDYIKKTLNSEGQIYGF